MSRQVRPVQDSLIATGGLCAPLSPPDLGVLANGPDVDGLAMIAVYPSMDEARSLVVPDGQEAEKIHVTLIFLGEVADLDMEAVGRAVAQVAETSAPISGEVGGVGVFGQGEEGYPQIALPDVKGLSTLRTRLEDALAAEDISSPSIHGWTPHLTLSYIDTPELPDTAAIGKSLTFGNLTLTASDVRTDYPFNTEEEEEDTESQFSARYSRSDQRRKALLLAQARGIV